MTDNSIEKWQTKKGKAKRQALRGINATSFEEEILVCVFLRQHLRLSIQDTWKTYWK